MIQRFAVVKSYVKKSPFDLVEIHEDDTAEKGDYVGFGKGSETDDRKHFACMAVIHEMLEFDSADERQMKVLAFLRDAFDCTTIEKARIVYRGTPSRWFPETWKGEPEDSDSAWDPF